MAARVFHEKGYDGASIQDLADALGMLKGSLYYYIDSKEDLLFDVLRSAHEDARANIALTDAHPGDALQRVRLFMRLHVLFNLRNLDRMGVFSNDFRSLRPDRRDEIRAYRNEYFAFAKRLIVDAQEARLACPDLDPTLTALAFIGMSNWVYEWYRPERGAAPEEIAESYADLAVAGIHCTPATHTPGHRAALAAISRPAARAG